MTSEAGDPRQALERERDRLDALLETNLTWRALRTLDGQVVADPAAALEAATLRARLEAELSDVRIYQARRKISEAITLLGAEPDALAAPPAAQPGSVDSGPLSTPADDLTRIRGVDAALAARLATVGVDSFAAIATWTAADVRRVAAALDLERTIQRQNWIEQAALILSRRRARSDPPPPPAERGLPRIPNQPPVPISSWPEVAELVAAAVRRIGANARPPNSPPMVPGRAADAAAVPPESTPAPILPPEPMPARVIDDLTAIRGLDARAAAALGAEGITSFAAIARWSASDVARLRGLLGAGIPILREEWIEQAAMLAAGHPSRFARTRAQHLSIPCAPRPALTAIARDEGFACALRRMWAATAQKADVLDDVGAFGQELALTGQADVSHGDAHKASAGGAADASMSETPPAAPRLKRLSIVVLPPQPIAALPSEQPVAPRATALALPPLTLQPHPETIASHADLETAVAAAELLANAEAGDGPVIDYNSDSLLDIAALSYSEADVRIVVAAPAPVADAPLDEPRPLIYGDGAGSLQSRLRKASDPGNEFDARDYAAYRSFVEEAAVEIVHRGATPDAGPAARIVPSSGAADGGPKTVRRFLKALTGQDR